MNSTKKVGVVCGYQFPEGMAPTTRIIAYCKGLSQNGVQTEVFTFQATDSVNDNHLLGVVDGIPYTKSYIKRGNSKWYAIIDKVSMLRRLNHQVKKSHQIKSFDCFLLSFDSLDKLYTIVPILKRFGKKLVFIGDEFPEAIRQLKERVPKWQLWLYRFIYRFIDARILMTNSLKRFYDEEVCPKPTYILNSIVDEKRFAGISKQPVSQKYLCYMGNMMIAKDNVDNLIQAFALISQEFSDYQLWLFGSPSQKDKEFVENVISETKMTDKVIIKGRVDYKEVPQILANATLLLTSQPITKRAEGGFPTKMAEYMMSGTPMIVTDVGEIHLYVQDMVNTYMVPPCNPSLYAEKIRFALDNPEVSNSIAERAYKYASASFTAESVTKGMAEFIEEITNNHCNK